MPATYAALLISAGGLVLSFVTAWGVASKWSGRTEARVDSVERDIRRLDREKASASELASLSALLTRIDVDMRANFAELKETIREARREWVSDRRRHDDT